MNTDPSDAVAVTGIGCRFAGGVDSAADLWRLLLAGGTTEGAVPPERWRAYAEHSREYAAALDRVVARGSFRDGIDGFDAAFFGIPAAEAEQLDPQQRMALEVSWEALEDAGVPPTGLAGSDTAVYFGVGTDDYGRRLLEDLPRVRAWTGIGASLCGVPNRISHALDLRGPSVAIDTACSSSLVAVHAACTALRAGETRLALAGGVMLMTGPGLTAVLGAAGALGPDGRCKPFDSTADGYGRGEGCGVVVLKRLADARADGDEVLAVIRGGAVRQDGRTEGIMAPSGQAQADLIRTAYRAAGVDPATVGYLEAHGTGTAAGDPTEADALCRTMSRPADRPLCWVGSVKANLGHTEAAAGIAGLIKATLVLRHRWIPATPHPGSPRSDLPWERAGLAPVPVGVPWPDPGHPRRAGVAGYGYGGTLAHLVLEQGDPQWTSTVEHGVPEGTHFPLSAASPAALAEQARRLADTLERPGAPALADLAATLHRGRARLRHRAVITAGELPGLRSGLHAVAAGDAAAEGSVTTGVAADGRDAVWVFSGHGAQWAGMGRGLLDTDPAFTEVIDRLAPVYRTELGVTPRELLEAAELDGVDRVQAALCALQLGLAATWLAAGLRPAAVIGHSVGEIAAAVTAGSLTEADAALLVCRRSALLPEAAGRGAMVLVDLPFDRCALELAEVDGVEAAISAAPGSTVAAGDPAAVARMAREWEARERTVRRIDSDVAFHTGQMRPLAERLAVAAAELRPRPPRVPLYTTALDDPRGEPRQDAAYWAANLRNPVRFAEAIGAAITDGHRTFLEVSAHPVVAHSITETLAAHEVPDGMVLPSLRRGRPEAAALAATVAALHCRGVPVALSAPAGRHVRLPGVAWQHTRFWAEHRPTNRPGPAHTLLGPGTDVHGVAARIWTTTLHTTTRPYPGRHPVLGVEIVPAAVTLLTYLTAAGTDELSTVELHRPVVVPEEDEDALELQVVRSGTSLRIASRLPGGDWSAHSVAHTAAAGPAATGCLDPALADEPLDAATVVDRLGTLGVAAMGFPWRVDKLSRGRGVLVAEVAADPEGVLRHRDWASLLDAALSTGSVAFDGPPELRMPAELDSVALTSTDVPDRAVVVTALVAGREHTVDVEIHGEDGTVLARLGGLRYAEPEGSGDTRPELGETVFDVRWSEVPAEPGSVPDPGTVVLTGPGHTCGLAAALATAGARVTETLPDGPAHLLVPAVADPARSVLALTGALRTALARPGTRVWALTTGVAAGRAAPGHAALAGLGPVLATEHPECFGGVLDLPADPPDEAIIGRLLHRLARPGTEPVITLTGTGERVPRAVPLGREAGHAPVCRPDGTYLITGGLGALGLTVAAHLAERGARRLVLLGRTPLPPRARWDATGDPRVAAVRAIEESGATVVPVATDLTDPAATRAALTALELPPIRGVLHAAGAVRSGPATELDAAELDAVLAAKVDGAALLAELFPPGRLDFLVLFSSAGPLLGLPGQAAYAAANACLDGLAARRRAAGDTGCVSIAWTSWRGLGMATAAAATDIELDARGSADLTAERMLAALDRILAARHRLGGAPVAVLPVRTDHPGPRPALLAGLDLGAAPATGGPAWTGLSGVELTAELTARAGECVAAVLGADPGTLDPEVALAEQGVDSLLGAMLRVRLERLTGLALAPTLLWNHPTIATIGGHLATRLEPAGHDGENSGGNSE